MNEHHHVSGATLTSNAPSNSATVGSPVEITCKYDKDGEKTSTVEWFKDGTAVSNGADYTIDNSKSAEQKSILKLTAAQSTVAKNGVYKCKITYDTVGAFETELTLYLQSAAPSTAKTYSAPGATVTISCVMYGNLKSTTTLWFKGTSSSAISTDSSYAVTAGEIVGNMRTDKLILKTVDALDSDTYKCEIASLSLSATQEFHIISKFDRFMNYVDPN